MSETFTAFGIAGATLGQLRGLLFRRRVPLAGFLLAILCLVFAFAAQGEQVFKLCYPTATELRCPPPIMFQFEKSPTPFNAPVTYGWTETRQGIPHWMWLKAGEPPTPCGAKELADKHYAKACKAKIGEPLFQTQRFTVTVK